jgi:hypothetical protein
MVFNAFVADAELLGNCSIRHALKAMHQEYPPSSTRHCEKRPSISSTQFR